MIIACSFSIWVFLWVDLYLDYLFENNDEDEDDNTPPFDVEDGSDSDSDDGMDWLSKL